MVKGGSRHEWLKEAMSMNGLKEGLGINRLK